LPFPPGKGPADPVPPRDSLAACRVVFAVRLGFDVRARAVEGFVDRELPLDAAPKGRIEKW